MKKLVSFFAAAALVATLMTTSSCTKTCDAGYQGSDCKTEVRAQYEGNWTETGTFSSNGTTGAVTALAVVRTAGSVVTDLLSTFSFNGTTYNIKSTVANSGSFTIPAGQTQPDGSTASGSGNFATAGSVVSVTETITLSYPAVGSASPYTVTVNLTGQKN